MFQSRGASDSALTTKSSATTGKEKVKPANSGAFKRTQPLKRLMTVPIPFHFTTQHRAEVRPPVARHVHTLESAASASIRTPPKRSRLAGVFPVPTGHPILTSSTHVEKPHFVPTVAISPKLGRHVHVPSLRPMQFVLRKSTKELTQPNEFQFHSDQRAREREEYDRQQSVRKREQELLDLQQKADKLHQEREKRMRMRESMERSFRARPIAHYQPTVIHKATRPLTKPVSPMIGEKRKRYEMEQQYLEQQQEEEEFEQHQQQQQPRQLGDSHGQRSEHYNNESHVTSSPTPGNIPDYEVYKSFEEAKILQAQQQFLQQQLTAQERRQVVLANSARATIHQPPIRLSFPMDPETEALQADDTPRQTHDRGEDVRGYEDPVLHQQAPSSSVVTVQAVDRPQPQPLPLVRDSFGGSNNHRLSRELRRISLEASRRISGERGARSRLSDNFSRRSASSAGSRKSGGETATVQEYYPFTRSQERTGASSTIFTGTRTTTATISVAPASTTVPASTTTTATVTSSAVATSTTPASAPISQPTATTSATAAGTTTSTIASTKSAPTLSTYRPVTASGQEKEERRRRSGSFIPLEPATKPTSSSTLSPSKSSRLSRLFGAPPVSSATKLYGDVKDSGTTATASSSSLARSKGPVVIEHTLTLSDL
ncbi:hypothetical protein BGZ95_003702 [Linnemannia exigua]|uniref:TPX2 C-terminal domain-containing protein n=1 Tax=Linnemannia exigua TaxID=604196 RepID=A0AAD4DI68_9FUNG|nr:hypothetical protein BGZ95_003702 [Linnemannia exigua]